MTDPIADMLTRIRNAVHSRHQRVDVPASRFKAEIARILEQEGYIQGFKIGDASRRRPAAAARRPVDSRISLEVRPARRERDLGPPAREPSGPPRLFRTRRRAEGDGRARHQHSHDLARRHDRTEAVKAGVGGEVLCNIW